MASPSEAEDESLLGFGFRDFLDFRESGSLSLESRFLRLSLFLSRGEGLLLLGEGLRLLGEGLRLLGDGLLRLLDLSSSFDSLLYLLLSCFTGDGVLGSSFFTSFFFLLGGEGVTPLLVLASGVLERRPIGRCIVVVCLICFS